MNRLYTSLNQYLLITLTVAFIIGISLHRFFPLPFLTISSISALFLLLVLYSYRHGKEYETALFLLLTVTSLGFSHAAYFQQRSSQENHIRTHISKETDSVLTGTLHSMVLFDGKKSTILLKSHSLRNKGKSCFTRVHGLVQLRLKGALPATIEPGTELVIRAQLSLPYRYGNPGGFDYPAFLASRNIHTIGRILTPAHIQVLANDPSWLHDLRYLPERVRIRVRNLIEKRISPQHAGIYKALLIGDRSTLSPAILEGFKASGCLHILAISGLHLSLLATALFFFCYWLTRRSERFMLHFSAKKTALIATIPLLCAYALIAGAQTPVLRSLIMVLVFILAFCSNKKQSPLTTLAAAALVVLLLNPRSLFTVSFQLSFAAVASLILVLPSLSVFLQAKHDKKQARHRIVHITFRWVCAALFVSIAATIGTAPLLIHSFHRISTVGPIANLLLEPLLCLWSLPLGLLAICFSFFSPTAAEWCLHLGEYGIMAAIYIANFFADISFSSLWFATPHSILIVWYYATLMLCLSTLSRSKTIPLFIVVCSLFFFPIQLLTDRFSNASEITFLDVGQGSSTFISFADGEKILIDGGGSSSSRFNVGEQIIAPYLWQRGISKLDQIIITHPDADHYNGIPFLLQHFQPDILWTNGETGHDQGYDDLLVLAKELGIAVNTPGRGEILYQSKDEQITNIGNPIHDRREVPQKQSTNSNDTSLIIRLQSSSFSCLFPGDISKQIEQQLLSKHNQLQSTFLLSPHHGSKTSNSKEFLTAVAPQKIIVSAGRFRPQIFPSRYLQEYCKINTIPLLNTAKTGAVTISRENGEIAVSTFWNKETGKVEKE